LGHWNGIAAYRIPSTVFLGAQAEAADEVHSLR